MKNLFRQFLKIKHFFHKKVSVMREDWDVLIILDALRYDIASINKEAISFNFNISKKISKGSSSPDFITKNFKENYFNTIVIASNPYVHKLKPKNFFLIVNAWDENWDESKGTVLPEDMHSLYLKYKSKYPNKRFIVWYMQPHFPYLTNTKYNSDYNIKNRGNDLVLGNQSLAQTALKKVEKGLIKKEEIIKIYNEEVVNIFKFLNQKIKDYKGKIIITADHGEAWDEFLWGLIKIYEHPSKTYTKSLTEIPWIEVIKKGARPSIKSDKTKDINKINSNLIERLQKLGYHE